MRKRIGKMTHCVGIVMRMKKGKSKTTAHRATTQSNTTSRPQKSTEDPRLRYEICTVHKSSLQAQSDFGWIEI